jgi:hypothetical protein
MNRSYFQAEFVSSMIEDFTREEIKEQAETILSYSTTNTLDINEMTEWEIVDIVANDIFDYYSTYSDEKFINLYNGQ